MANTLRWVGGAAPVAQIQTFTFGGTWLAADIVTLACGELSIPFVVGSTTIATFLATLQAAINALAVGTYPEIAEATVANTSTTLVFTANTAGYPFTFTLATNSSSGTIVGATTTPSSGPLDWSTPQNWTGGKSGVITGATNAMPISITSTAHGLLSSDQITITNVAGNTAANGIWNITKIDANTFTLVGSSGNGTYTSSTGNWAACPTAGDTFNIDNSSDNIMFGLNQSLLGVLVAGNIYSSFTGTLGLPKINQNGTPYPEYRPDYLQINVTTLTIGIGPGQGSGRIKHDAGSATTTWNVYNASTGLDQGIEAVLLKGTSSSNSLNVTYGTVGVAIFGGEAANLSGGYSIGYTTSPSSDVAARFGAGVTLAAGTQTGGTLILASAIGTSHTQTGGVCTFNGSGAAAQLTISAGTFIYNSTGTIGGNTVVGAGGFLDFDQMPPAAAVTVTNPIVCYTFPGFQDNGKRTGAIVVDYKQISVTGWGWNVRQTRGTPASN